MIEKVIRREKLREVQAAARDLSFWLSRSPEERVAAVDHLRRQCHGSGARLQKLLESLNAHEVEYVIVD